jgi:hypothetical protein
MSGIQEAGFGRIAAPRSTSIVSFNPGLLAKRPEKPTKKLNHDRDFKFLLLFGFEPRFVGSSS